MIAQNKLRRQSMSLCHRSPQQVVSCIEPLEGRRLLSFSTVDLAPGHANDCGVAADGQGNVYVAGELTDTGGYYVREGAAGGTWSDIFTATDPTGWGPAVHGVGASPSGNVYVAYGTDVLERPAGSATFSQVLSGAPGDSFDRRAQLFSSDAANNVYYTSMSGSGSQVWRQQGGTGAFAVVDSTPTIRGTAVYATTQAVYEVGYRIVAVNSRTNVYHWMVRKSVTGAANTWSTVDDFVLDPADNLSSVANAVTVDGKGNVFVGGVAAAKVKTSGKSTNINYAVVRKSIDGGVTWSTDKIDSAPTINAGISVNGLGVDAAGNVYMAESKSVSGVASSIVNMKPVGGSSWSVVDQVGGNAVACGFVVDSNNNLCVSGASGSEGFVRTMPGAPAPAMITPTIFASTSDNRPHYRPLDLASNDDVLG